MNSDEVNIYDFLHVLLWSESQGALHVETLADTVRDGQDALMNRREPHDWVTMDVGPEGFIRRRAEELRPIVKARHKYARSVKSVVLQIVNSPSPRACAAASPPSPAANEHQPRTPPG